MPKQIETADAIANSPQSEPLLDFVLDIFERSSFSQLASLLHKFFVYFPCLNHYKCCHTN